MLPTRFSLKRLLPCAAFTTLLLTTAAHAGEPIKVGLVAALSGQSAKSGEALTRGLSIAIDEVNAAGGVLGRPLELVRRDDESNPSKGMLAARELIQREKVTLLFGGLDTPVSLAIVPLANQLKVPFMASGPPAPRSPRTAPQTITCSASRRSMNWWTKRWWITACAPRACTSPD